MRFGCIYCLSLITQFLTSFFFVNNKPQQAGDFLFGGEREVSQPNKWPVVSLLYFLYLFRLGKQACHTVQIQKAPASWGF
jgi:hypothetical protein